MITTDGVSPGSFRWYECPRCGAHEISTVPLENYSCEWIFELRPCKGIYGRVAPPGPSVPQQNLFNRLRPASSLEQQVRDIAMIAIYDTSMAVGLLERCIEKDAPAHIKEAKHEGALRSLKFIKNVIEEQEYSLLEQGVVDNTILICGDCNGTGKLDDEDCRFCNGQGKFPAPQ